MGERRLVPRSGLQAVVQRLAVLSLRCWALVASGCHSTVLPQFPLLTEGINSRPLEGEGALVLSTR